MVYLRRMIRICCAFLIVSLLVAACAKPEKRAAPGFYYWKTNFKLSSEDCLYLNETKCKSLYVKFLDIGISPETGQMAPLSQLSVSDTTGLAGIKIIPCVFMMNRVFHQINAEKIDWLAGKTINAIQKIGAHFPGFSLDKNPETHNGAQTTNEIQIDCDWTTGTRDAYFLFLKKLKSALPAHLRLSATIRLHQYKFPEQTGVPPVDRGMLMCYNTGDIDNPNEENSILQPKDVRKYLNGAPKNYPIALDIVLPLFSWALVYRDDALWKIITDLQPDTFSDTTKFKPNLNVGDDTENHRYLVKKGNFLNAYYLRAGDLIRIEGISPALLQETAALAAQTDLADDPVIAFFELDASNLHPFSPQLLNSVWQSFGTPH
ncbi:MAG: hypothetical protein WCR52_10160 [Bacteroidota bacterium]